MAYGFNEDKSKVDVLGKGDLLYFETNWSILTPQGGAAFFGINNIPESCILISCEYEMAENKTGSSHVWEPLSNNEAWENNAYRDVVSFTQSSGFLSITKYNHLASSRYIRVRGVLLDTSAATEI